MLKRFNFGNPMTATFSSQYQDENFCKLWILSRLVLVQRARDPYAYSPNRRAPKSIEELKNHQRALSFSISWSFGSIAGTPIRAGLLDWGVS